LGADHRDPTRIYAIDTGNAKATLIATTGPAQGPAATMAVANASTVLLLTDTPSNQSLQSVDLATGATADLGALGRGGIFAMDFGPDGRLYGLAFNGSGHASQEYLINPVDGGLTLVGGVGNPVFLDLAIPSGASVPEPSSLTIAGIAVLVGLISTWRRPPRTDA
jgi:hypothetical protein